jgi:hypothetical protein
MRLHVKINICHGLLVICSRQSELENRRGAWCVFIAECNYVDTFKMSCNILDTHEFINYTVQELQYSRGKRNGRRS